MGDEYRIYARFLKICIGMYIALLKMRKDSFKIKALRIYDILMRSHNRAPNVNFIILSDGINDLIGRLD